MRRGLPGILLVFSFACGGSGDGTGEPPTVMSHPPGQPVGPPVTAMVGPAGGTVASADGALELAIPPGALAAATAITVQPITNQAPGGLGTAYRLGPEGQTFAQPVELVFHASDAELAGTALEALGVGFQDAQGRWRALNTVSRDGGSRLVKGSTSHFSDWSLLAGFVILPPSATVKVGESVSLSLYVCERVTDEDLLTSLVAECQKATVVNHTARWSVNGIANGDATVGTLAVDRGADVTVYTAPARRPPRNPVAVGATFNTVSGLVTVVANVDVIDMPDWTGHIDVTQRETMAGNYDIRLDVTTTVDWIYDKSTDRYRPSGAVHATLFESNIIGGCDTSGTWDGPIGELDGSIGFDESVTPALYAGTGTKIVHIDGTSNCNPQHQYLPEPIDIALPWWATSGGWYSVQPDGVTIDDGYTTPPPSPALSVTSHWHFAQR